MQFVKEIGHRYISVATSLARAVVARKHFARQVIDFCMGKERRKMEKEKLGIKNGESWHIVICRLTRTI